MDEESQTEINKGHIAIPEEKNTSKFYWIKTHKKILGVLALVIVIVVIAGVFIKLVKKDETIKNKFKTQDTISLGTETLVGKVSLPDNSPFKFSDLHVSTLLDDKAVGPDGRFSLTGFDAGRQLAMATDAKGQAIFFGFIDSKNQEISSETTAEVLLFQASGAMYLPYSAWPVVLDAIQIFVSKDMRLAEKIGLISNQNPQYLTDGNKELALEINSALQRLKDSQAKSSAFWQLFTPPLAQAQTGHGIDTDEKSAVRIDRGIFNEIKITNGYR